MSNETTEFFQRLLGSVPEYLWGHLWTLGDKRSHWISLADGPDAFAAKAEELSTDTDTYVAVSVADAAGDARRRIAAINSVGIFGLWADIDIANSVHSKSTRLPPDEASALLLLEECGARPTITLNSGHGLQCWWVFNEFWEFTNEQDRMAAADLARRWNSTLRVRAATHGWVVDSTFDLSRVMRIPGTLNFKGDEPIMAETRWADGPLWSPESIGDYLLDDSQAPNSGMLQEYQWDSGTVVIDPDADPPADKHSALRDNDDKYKRTWEHSRPDIDKGDDPSLSSYDLALVNPPIMAGWTDQELINLIIAFRRKHGSKDERAKGCREDYLRRTIGRARSTLVDSRLPERLDEAPNDLRSARATGDDEALREKSRETNEMLSKALLPPGMYGHWIKFESAKPTYALEITTLVRSINFGESGVIFNQGACRQVIWDTFGFQFRRMKTREWDMIVSAIGAVCESRSVGEEATEHGQMRMWLREYLDDYPPVNAEETDQTHFPIKTSDGTVKIMLDTLKDWLYYSQRVTPPERGPMALPTRLRSYGAIPSTVRVRLASGAVRADHPCWILPTDGGDR